jgi:hypothetical protein
MAEIDGRDRASSRCRTRGATSSLTPGRRRFAGEGERPMSMNMEIREMVLQVEREIELRKAKRMARLGPLPERPSLLARLIARLVRRPRMAPPPARAPRTWPAEVQGS